MQSVGEGEEEILRGMRNENKKKQKNKKLCARSRVGQFLGFNFQKMALPG
jgi:hypothetical protein